MDLASLFAGIGIGLILSVLLDEVVKWGVSGRNGQ